MAKLADFGLATTKNIANIKGSKGGTRAFAPPQFWSSSPHDGKKADIFSLGVLLYVILVGKHPFVSAKHDDLGYSLIRAKKYEQFWQSRSTRVLS
jgi:serine/threonine protein kinase